MTSSLADSISTLGSIDTDEIDWARARSITILIQQTYRYEYPGTITDLRHRLMVVPPDRHGNQRLVTHKLRVSTSPLPGWNLDNERSHDSFGNVVLDLTLQVVDRAVEFMTWAVVEHSLAAGDEAPVVEFDPRFGEPSRLTQPTALLRTIAADAAVSGLAERERVMLLGELVHERFDYEPGVTDVDTTAAMAWEQSRGVCQDYAHCLLALCRLNGIPARYVSGHLLGEGAPHAWVEACVRDGEGRASVIAFDPTHNRCTGPRYVTVAVGRDYLDAAPTAGTFVGAFPGSLTTYKRAAVTRIAYR